ncbi:DUF4331 family protein [Ferruginibacter sp. SUN002]|uniref:DUF4331 family protein n=1 Tax=Ferruginibacter sp. SUN002 TaxID=2937789 RepID=UPI003D36F8DD
MLKIKLFASVIAVSLLIVSCKKDTTPVDNSIYAQQDQMGRPAINTVFNSAADKDAFNTTTPSAMNAAFQTKFQSRLLALNPGYTTNALGQDAAALTGLLATDYLNVSTKGVTTFFDGTNILTGRTLSDDVIDVELLLLFGGPTGASNSGLTSDHVNGNDKTFSASFPYLASPW